MDIRSRNIRARDVRVRNIQQNIKLPHKNDCLYDLNFVSHTHTLVYYEKWVGNILLFNSSYTWRFYEILVSWAQPKAQTQGRFELARSLAIPRYEQNSQIDDLAKGSMQLASGTARALMHSAAAVTGRSENFAAMMANEQTMHDQRLINIDAFDL